MSDDKLRVVIMWDTGELGLFDPKTRISYCEWTHDNGTKSSTEAYFPNHSDPWEYLEDLGPL